MEGTYYFKDPEELAEAVQGVLKQGSINLYMFVGNQLWFREWLFSVEQLISHKSLPMTTMPCSNEAGNPTPKYFAVQKMLRLITQNSQMEPLVKGSFEQKYFLERQG